ncbi:MULTISPECIES: hypothetical protein [Pseudomonas]|uniref:hypothetical protein n=1 Tax=Pseudomonas TaxID=286 RepID=UPI001474AF87|nr:MULTISPECIES: hypothetical protein [Pseudomonas]MBH3423561.1 hypothetical protein [Pseudomonas gessardii]
MKLSFQWGAWQFRECFIAISEAVRLGYATNDELINALPQFTVNRLVLGLDKLLAAEMSHINMGTLSIDDDIRIVEALTAGQVLELPLNIEQLERNDPLMRKILMGIGVRNPAGALALLKPKVEGV